VAALLVLCATTLVAGIAPVSATTAAPTVRCKLLTLSNLPPGWTLSNPPVTDKGISGPCAVALNPKPQPGLTKAYVAFSDRGRLPLLAEELSSGPRVGARYRYVDAVLKSCTSMTFSFSGLHEKGTVRPLPFPGVGSSSSAFRISVPTALGVNLGIDLMVARSGPYAVVLEYAVMGTPSSTVLRAFVNQALAKVTGQGSTAPSPNEVPPKINPTFQ
jgi:hypothetical protein